MIKRKWVWALVGILCIAFLLLPSAFSSLVWGPINILIHGFAILLFVLTSFVYQKRALFTLPVVAIFLSFMPYFDWLQYVDSFEGAHWPELEMIRINWTWHLIFSVWSATFLLGLHVAQRKLQSK